MSDCLIHSTLNVQVDFTQWKKHKTNFRNSTAKVPLGLQQSDQIQTKSVFLPHLLSVYM